MKQIDDNIQVVSLTLKGAAKEVKYSYTKAEGGEEIIIQEMTRGKKYQELKAFFDFVDSGYVNSKKRFI